MVHYAHRRPFVSRHIAALTPLLHWLKRPLGRALVQGLVFVLAFHGWPVAHLGQRVQRDLPRCFLSSSSGEAAGEAQ
jgi:hypothetical protein